MMTKFSHVLLALLALVVLSSCDKSCEYTSHDALYVVKLDKDVRVSQFDPSNGKILSHDTLAAGTMVTLHHKAGAATGDVLKVKTGALVGVTDSTGSTMSYVCDECASGMVTENQSVSYMMCPPMPMACIELPSHATMAGSASGHPIKPGDTIIFCWPSSAPMPPSGSSYTPPFVPDPSDPTRGVGMPVIVIDSFGGSGFGGILETPMIVTID